MNPIVIIDGVAYRLRNDRLELVEQASMHRPDCWMPAMRSGAAAKRALGALLVAGGGYEIPAGILKSAEIFSILLPRTSAAPGGPVAAAQETPGRLLDTADEQTNAETIAGQGHSKRTFFGHRILVVHEGGERTGGGPLKTIVTTVASVEEAERATERDPFGPAGRTSRWFWCETVNGAPFTPSRRTRERP